MDSLMLLGLPGRQLYCLMPTDQYHVFQHYFIRRRSTRSPRDIRHAEISRYTPEASGGRKHAQVQDLRIPRRAVAGFDLKMRRTPFLGLDNCARLKLKLSDGTVYRFAVLGSHTQSELREIFGIGGKSAEPRVYEARSGFTPPAAKLPSFVPPTPAPVRPAPLRNREARRERVRAHLEDMAERRNEKLEPLMGTLTFLLFLPPLFLSFWDSRMLFGSRASALLVPGICIACILAMLILPIVLPQWYCLFPLGRHSKSKAFPIGTFVFYPAVLLILRSFLVFAGTSTTRRIAYLSLPRFFLIAAIPGAVIALLVWIFAKERKFAPVALTVYCCVLLVLLVGIGGRINTLDAENPSDRTEWLEVVDRHTGEATFAGEQKITVRTSEGELTVYVPDWASNLSQFLRSVRVDFYDGTLGIPFAIARVD